MRSFWGSLLSASEYLKELIFCSCGGFSVHCLLWPTNGVVEQKLFSGIPCYWLLSYQALFFTSNRFICFQSIKEPFSQYCVNLFALQLSVINLLMAPCSSVSPCSSRTCDNCISFFIQTPHRVCFVFCTWTHDNLSASGPVCQRTGLAGQNDLLSHHAKHRKWPGERLCFALQPSESLFRELHDLWIDHGLLCDVKQMLEGPLRSPATALYHKLSLYNQTSIFTV